LYNVQDYSVIYNNVACWLYVRIGISRRKHLHARFISLRGALGSIKLV